MNKPLYFLLICGLISSCKKDSFEEPIIEKELLSDVESLSFRSIEKIPNLNFKHNAFTDLIFFENTFFLSFRSSDTHVWGDDGIVQLYSKNSESSDWTFIESFRVSGYDLRDPSFSVNNEGDLNMYIHAAIYSQDRILEKRNDFISTFNPVNNSWSDLVTVSLDPGESGNYAWPWKIKWFNDEAFSFAYRGWNDFDFYSSSDGLSFFESESELPFYTDATEADLEISPNGIMYSLVRRKDNNTTIISSSNPKVKWSHVDDIPIRNLGGPCLHIVNDSVFLISGRKTYNAEVDSMLVAKYTLNDNVFTELITLPGKKDLGYPGIVIEDHSLFLSYYATDENDSTFAYFCELDIK